MSPTLRCMERGARPASTWSDEYREMIEFYYWEPQHLGRMKKPLSRVNSADAAWQRVSGLEVATNHILNLYFAIVTLQVINGDEAWATGDTYRCVAGRELEEVVRAYDGFTQPDLLFRGLSNDCAIELKTKGKTSISQVQKYATLQALTRPEKPLTLVLLTPHGDPSSAFQEALPDLDAVHQELTHRPPLSISAGSPSESTYRNVLAALEVRLRSYDDLHTSVRQALLAEDNSIARRVHQGVLSWLTGRGLCNPGALAQE